MARMLDMPLFGGIVPELTLAPLNSYSSSMATNLFELLDLAIYG